MKQWVIFTVLLLGLSFASAQSSYKSDFIVDGCQLGEKGLAVGACSKDGRHFCKASSEEGARPILMDTLLDGNACAFGSGAPGATQCCPSGYVCDAGTVKCVQRTANCGSWTSQSDCAQNSCTWVDRGGGEGVCVDRPTDYSCSVYTTQTACQTDVWNLGSNGIGTDLCGSTFTASYQNITKGYVVSPSSCGCVWDQGACKLKYEIADDIYRGTKESVECLKSYTAGQCVSGSQEVSWTASNRDSTFSASITEVLRAGECESGIGERSCGEPVFKLPAFSPFAFAFAVLLLIAYYSFAVRRE